MHAKHYFSAFVLFLLFQAVSAYSSVQDNKNTSEKQSGTFSNLAKSETRKVDKVNTLMSDASKLLEQAINMSNKEKATAQLKLSLDKCSNASEILKDL